MIVVLRLCGCGCSCSSGGSCSGIPRLGYFYPLYYKAKHDEIKEHDEQVEKKESRKRHGGLLADKVDEDSAM